MAQKLVKTGSNRFDRKSYRRGRQASSVVLSTGDPGTPASAATAATDGCYPLPYVALLCLLRRCLAMETRTPFLCVLFLRSGAWVMAHLNDHLSVITKPPPFIAMELKLSPYILQFRAITIMYNNNNTSASQEHRNVCGACVRESKEISPVHDCLKILPVCKGL